MERPRSGMVCSEPVMTIRLRHWPLLWGFLLAVTVFAVNLHFAFALDQVGAFTVYNLLFDADPNTRLNCFVSGWGDGCRNSAHPNLGNLFNPPIRIVAAGLSLVTGGDESLFRRTLALSLNPLASALSVTMIFLTFRRLGFSVPRALLPAALAGFSFSQLVFGSMPEHFAISGAVLSVALWLAVEAPRRGAVRWKAWIALGTVAMGITITNLVIVMMLFMAGLVASGRRWGTAVLHTSKVGSAALLLTILISLPADRLYGEKLFEQGHGETATWIASFLNDDFPGRLIDFPTALANAISPPLVLEIAPRNLEARHYAREFSLEAVTQAPTRLASLTLNGLLVVAILFALRSPKRNRLWVAAGFAILAYNALFHSFWGYEYFLYSQHWMVAAVLLAGLGLLSERGRYRTGFWLFALLIGTAAINNLFRMQELIAATARLSGQG